MHSLVRTILELSRARSVEDVAAVVRVAARALTGADGATFVLKDGNQCHYLDEDAIGPLWKGKRFPAASCISGWSMEQRRVAAIEDIYRDSRIPHDAYRPTFVKSLVMVPIRSYDPIGAIGNYWAEPHRPTADEIEVLQALADSTAIAMENAYLHESMQRQVDDRTRELQLARQQAENANAMKSRFLAAASHNLRQPIQTLNTLLAILQRTRNGHDDESRPHIEAMAVAIRNMESMLETLLDLHRLEAGAVEAQPCDTSLDAVLAHLRSEFSYVANAKGLTLEIPQTLPVVHTDAHLLQEILRNFISNGIKYTATGGVRLTHRSEGDAVVVTVADSGPGIPAPYLGRIFEAFYRAPDAGAGAEGLGLGLSIADQLARILGHRLEAESSAGGGSRFSIVVPRAHAAVAVASATAAMPSPRPASGSRKPARILYVEDDPSVRESLALLLDIEGYEVTVAASGGEALDLVCGASCDPQVVISDFHLPGGETGEQVVDRVRKALGHPVPALLLTGETREIRSPTPAGVTHRVLRKPVNADVLLDEVAALVAGA